jgi:hypothetical protein
VHAQAGHATAVCTPQNGLQASGLYVVRVKAGGWTGKAVVTSVR